MKKQITILAILLLIAAVYSCKRDKTTEEPPAQTDHYTSTANFFAVNAPAMQTFTVNAATGGSFTTPKGTIVTVPANAFLTKTGGAVSGNVTIQFKDVYKKSDMVLCELTTQLGSYGPMKSAGMFFIKAMQGASAVVMAPAKKILINQPFNGVALDTLMNPFVLVDTIVPGVEGANVWFPNYQDTVLWNAYGYVFSLYQFNFPADSGSWCNSDNPSFFSAYPQTQLTLHPNDNMADYRTEVFLIFSGVNSMVHVYSYGGTNFPYYFSPIGLQCTAVAIGVKDGKLYSSFTPITITANLTVNFSLSETTTADFKTQLEALN